MAMGAPGAQEDLGAQEAQEVQEALKEQEDVQGRRALDLEAINHGFCNPPRRRRQWQRPLQERARSTLERRSRCRS